MATPPAIRHRLNANKVAAMPVPTDDTANTTAARIKRRLRPNLSLEPPATTRQEAAHQRAAHRPALLQRASPNGRNLRS